MNRLKVMIIKLLGFLVLLTISTCGHPPDLIPDGIYGHPGDEDDQFEIPDNATPIDYLNDSKNKKIS